MRNQDFVKNIATISQFVILSTDTEVDDTVIDELTDALGQIDTTGEPDFNKALEAAIDIITDLIPGEVDDLILQGVYNMFKGQITETGEGWISKIRANIKERRENRRARKAQ